MHDTEPGAAQQANSYSWDIWFKLCGQLLTQKASPDKVWLSYGVTQQLLT